MLGKLAFTNKIVAKNLDVDEERVTRIMDFFVDELNKELISCEHPFVYVRGLGTFTMALRPIETKIKRALKHIENYKKEDTRNSQERILALRRTIFELFAMRRLLKKKRKEVHELKQIKCLRKGTNDNKGELLPANGKE